jgi:glycosyltransferase involved in cell wall biosynthesis
MCAVEAMACGCALVTTANGGSADYAVDGETALVCGPDTEKLAEAVVRLVTDDDLRVRIAENGCRFVERFRWGASAERLTRVAVDALNR